MTRWAFNSIVAVLGLTVLVPVVIARGNDEWHRVVTGPGFNIDVSATSLRLEPDRILSARFKTTLSKSENVGGKSSEKYKTRLETIQFNSSNQQYRIRETTFLDSSGKLLLSISSEDWKPIRSGTSSRLYAKAKTLPPFGTWKVITYRYADGKPAAIDDPPDVRKLIGGSLWLTFDNVQLAGERCSGPSFELNPISNEQFVKRIGHPLTAIGVDASRIDSVLMKCEPGRSDLEQTFFLQLVNGKMLLLWDGVFVELESPKDGLGISLLKLITN